MDLIINSESDLALKVMGTFSLYCSEKNKYDTLFFGFKFMTSNSYIFDNCHSSYPVFFLYFLYKLNRILFVKIFGNPLNLAYQSRSSAEVSILLVLNIS